MYRARTLGLLTDEQYRSAAISLKRTGQAIQETEDDSIPLEEPSLLRRSFELLAKRRGLYGTEIAHDLKVSVDILQDLVGFALPQRETAKAPLSRPSLRLVA